MNNDRCFPKRRARAGLYLFASIVSMALLPLVLTGCASSRNNSALFGGQSCSTGDDADCSSVGKGGKMVFVQGGTVSFDPLDKSYTVTEAELVEILEGPAVRSTSSGQSLGTALNTAVGGLVGIAQKANEQRDDEDVTGDPFDASTIADR